MSENRGLVSPGQTNLIKQTAKIVVAYLSRNLVQPSDIPSLIANVHGSLVSFGQPQKSVDAESEPLRPAVPIRKSVQPDHIVCLEDGKKLKMLK